MTFYRSHGNYCAETTLKSALSLKGIDKKISEIILKTNHKKDKGLWPVELASALIDLEILFEYQVKENFVNIYSQQELKQKILEYYGKDNGLRIIQESNLPNIIASQSRILNNGLFQLNSQEDLSLEKKIRGKKFGLILINSDKYFKRPDKNHGHYLLITGQDKNFYDYYDCGPKSFNINGKILKTEMHMLSRNISMLDWGFLII